MYSIVLENGTIVNIRADSVEWCEKSNTVRFLKGRRVVSRVNMNNIVGWIDVDYKAASEV